MGGGCGFKPGGGLSRRQKDSWVKELKVLTNSKIEIDHWIEGSRW